MNRRRTMPFLVLTLLAIASIESFAQMVHPSIDRDDEPFCYYSRPTDVIGVMDGREGTLVSPEGYLYTGFGELMFFTGNPPEPASQRVKTLYKGYLPIIEYPFEKEAIRYQFTMFATTLDGRPESPLMNFIRVKVRNRSRERRTAYLGIGIRYQNDANTTWGVGDNRFGRPAKAALLGQYEQAGVEFSRDWEYRFEDDALLRDRKVMYLFPTSPKPELMLTQKTGYNEKGTVAPETLFVLPTTPVGIVNYRLGLKPGEETALVFKMPYEPILKDDALVRRLRLAAFDEYFQRTVADWEKVFSDGIDISLPEEKVVNTFKANLVYDLIARNKVDSFYIQNVNEFQYDAFWLRDASYIVRMYDLSGYHTIARQCLDFFPRWQRSDGNFVSQGGQYDGWGQTLWAFGQHYRMTRDVAFAERVLPLVKKAVAWLQQARAADPLHLVPVTTPGDNENITGHVTGHNFWALVGLKNAVALAEGLNQDKEADDFRREYDDLKSALLRRLHTLTKTTAGYIPPGLDSLGGQDWGNMLSVYPEIILDPFDPMVTATLQATRAKYQEGIMTYGDGRWLHHYLTMKNTETEVIRGDQQWAIEEFCALLVHTSATHAGFEFSILPWGTRDFGMNLSPHGWFGAKYRALLRNMLAREQDDQLHLLSCVSPEWIGPGKTIKVRRAPTVFGQVNFELKSALGGAVLTLENKYIEQPRELVLHIPWFMNVQSVSADGRRIPVSGPAVTLPAEVREVRIRWSKKTHTPPLSYENAVTDFKKEYRRRYGEFVKNGN